MTDNELSLIELDRTIRANEVTRQINEEARINGEKDREASIKTQIDSAIETITNTVATSDKVIVAINENIDSKVTPVIEEFKESTSSQISSISSDVSELQDSKYPTNNPILIPDGADLNDYKTPGIYCTNTGASYNTLVNTYNPGLENGGKIIIVTKATEAGMINQQVIDSQKGAVFNRRFNNGVWENWHCPSGIDSIVAEGTSGNWRWVKYANGKAVATANYNLNLGEEITVPANSCHTEIKVPLPFNFYNHVCTASGNASNMAIYCTWVQDVSVNIRIWNLNSYDKITSRIQPLLLHVDGYWK